MLAFLLFAFVGIRIAMLGDVHIRGVASWLPFMGNG